METTEVKRVYDQTSKSYKKEWRTAEAKWDYDQKGKSSEKEWKHGLKKRT